jgi:hypothetical protein
VNELPYFMNGIDYLAPGAERSTMWDSMITLKDFLEERGTGVASLLVADTGPYRMNRTRLRRDQVQASLLPRLFHQPFEVLVGGGGDNGEARPNQPHAPAIPFGRVPIDPGPLGHAR